MAILDYVNPKHVPKNGLFISANSRLFFRDSNTNIDYNFIRANSGLIRWRNGVGVYFENSRQTGITFAGNFDVSGSMSRAFVSFAEARLAIGVPNPDHIALEDLVKKVNADGGKVSMGSKIDLTRYGIRDLIVGMEVDSEQLDWGPVEFLIHKPVFPNANISFSANDIINSGPMDFTGSFITINKMKDPTKKV